MAKKLVQNFTTNELKKLVNDKTSCVLVHKSIYSLQIYPYHLTDISSSIKELLNNKIAKYDQKLNGILLGYKNLKLLTPQGSIICDSCFIHIDIEGDFYIFKPEIESLLTGVVNKKSNNHVGCLVHRLFNVSVPNTDEEDWAGHNVSIGDELILKIVYMDLDARLPYIKSQLVEIKTKVMKQEDITEDVEDAADFKTPEESPKKKKKKRDKLKLEEGSTQEESNNESDSPSKKKKKKLKNQNVQLEELETSYNDSQEDLKFNKSLTKKKKKVKPEKAIDNKVEIEDLETNGNESQAELFPEESLSLPKKIKKVKLENIDPDTQKTVNKSEEKKKRRSIETINTIFNGNYPDSSLDESITKKKKKNKLENLEVDVEVNSKKSENKKKRKSTDVNIGENNNSDQVHKENGYDEIGENNNLCQLEDIVKILNCEKSPKMKKKRKSGEHKSKRESLTRVETTFLADSEDRKSKKRKSSLDQNVIWDNKELDLHDSELEKTLGESWKPPIDESLKFNLVKIAALNESNKIKRNSTNEVELQENKVEKKKRKRKSGDVEPEPKKKKQNDVNAKESHKKKSKVKT